MGRRWAEAFPDQAALLNAGQQTREEIEEEGSDVEAHLTPFADMPAARGEDT